METPKKPGRPKGSKNKKFELGTTLKKVFHHEYDHLITVIDQFSEKDRSDFLIKVSKVLLANPKPKSKTKSKSPIPEKAKPNPNTVSI